MTKTPPQPSDGPPSAPPHHTKHHQRRRHCTSCIIATTTFLILLTLTLPILFYTLFRPQNPIITTLSVHLPSFSTSTNSSTTTTTTTLATFTFSLYASVKNPNRFSVFSHFDSSLHLLHANHQVGFIYIPAGKVGSGRTQYVSAAFAVQSFPVDVAVAVDAPEPAGMDVLGEGFGGGTRLGPSPSLEIESRVIMKGRIRFLHFFTYHAKSVSDCSVHVDLSDGSVLGFHC